MPKLLEAIQEIFPLFAVDFQIKLPVESDDSEGGFFGTPDNPSTLTTIHEPLLPADGNTMLQALEAGGQVTSFAYQWWSTNKYPMNTEVDYRDHHLIVNKIDDYFDQAGVYIYYLNDRSDR